MICDTFIVMRLVKQTSYARPDPLRRNLHKLVSRSGLLNFSDDSIKNAKKKRKHRMLRTKG